MTLTKANNSFTFDDDLAMKAAGLVASTTDHTTIDLGGSGYMQGVVVIDVSAIEVATGDESYQIEFQLSSDNFAAETIVKAVLPLGDSTVNGGTSDSTTGRYTLPVNNEWFGEGYRYCRLSTTVAGAIATGINFTAYLTK